MHLRSSNVSDGSQNEIGQARRAGCAQVTLVTHALLKRRIIARNSNIVLSPGFLCKFTLCTAGDGPCEVELAIHGLFVVLTLHFAG